MEQLLSLELTAKKIIRWGHSAEREPKLNIPFHTLGFCPTEGHFHLHSVQAQVKKCVEGDAPKLFPSIHMEGDEKHY